MANIQDFINWQQNVLFSIAEPYLQTLDTLDCNSDESSLKRKDDIWSKITEEYNTKCSSEPLSTDTIQKYYKCKCQEKDLTQQDVDLLRKITAEYKHIIENIQSDTESLKDKEVAWAEITIQFNAQCSNDNLQTKNVLQQYYESRFIQSSTKSTKEEEANIITDKLLVKDEMLAEIVPDALCADILMTVKESSTSEEQTDFQELDSIMLPVKQETIEETDESAPGIEEINLSPEFKQEFIDEEESEVVDPMEIRNQNVVPAPENEESASSEEDKRPVKRTYEKAFGFTAFLESSSSSSSSDDDNNEINRFLNYETKLKILQDKIEMDRQHQLKKLELEKQKLLLNLEMQENRLRQFKEESDLRLKLLELDVEITKKQLELTKKSMESK